MAPNDPAGAREFLEAIIAAFSILGGVMAYFSGYAAYRSLREESPPSNVADDINQGLGVGFALGVPSAILALYDYGMALMNRFLRSPHSALIVGTVTSTMVGIAVFVLRAPPIILLPAILIVGTVHFELKLRATHRFDRR